MEYNPRFDALRALCVLGVPRSGNKSQPGMIPPQRAETTWYVVLPQKALSGPQIGRRCA